MKTSLTFLFALFCFVSFAQQKSFKPGEIWPDNTGVHINAHGGGILGFNGVYYWFGEHKTEGRKGNNTLVGVHCYSSKDLYNWKDEGIALKVTDDTTSLIRIGCVIERPKVIYNKKTKKFVMWFHHELRGKGYSAAMTGVAVSDKATGPYTWLKSVNPNAGIWPANFTAEQKAIKFTEKLKDWSEEWKTAVKHGLFIQRDLTKGQMARDMTLYVDDNGKAYHIHASEENLTLHISELNDDYTDFTGKYITVAPAGHNEAPSLFKKDEKLFHDHIRLYRLGAQCGTPDDRRFDYGRMELSWESLPWRQSRHHLQLAEHIYPSRTWKERSVYFYGRSLGSRKCHRWPLYLASSSVRSERNSIFGMER